MRYNSTTSYLTVNYTVEIICYLEDYPTVQDYISVDLVGRSHYVISYRFLGHITHFTRNCETIELIIEGYLKFVIC